MSKIQLAIDIGSGFTTIYQRGVGLVLREPSLAIASFNRGRGELKEAGYRAKSMLSQSLGGARVIAPIKEGCVADAEMAASLFSYFLKKIIPDSFIKPSISVIALISSALINSERKSVERALLKAGVKELLLVESPLALLSYTGSIGGLFVDIGAGKTEIAAVTNQGIASGGTINIAGAAFNNAIIDCIAELYAVKIGDYTAEKLKIDSLSLYENDANISHITGRSLLDGAPKNIAVKANDLFKAVAPLVDELIEVVKHILASTPPELSAEVLRKGVFLCGGSSQIPGIKEYISKRLTLPIIPLDDTENAVAIGGGYFFSDKAFLSDLLGVRVD